MSVMGLKSCVSLLLIITVAKCFGRSTSQESYIVYNQLQDALIKGNTSEIPNLQVLADTFFPKQRAEPVCVPVRYTLRCSTSELDFDFEESETNSSRFLWTQSFVSFSTSALLLSYSKSGITLKGFEWDKSCVFIEEINIMLQPQDVDCSSQVLDECLQRLTSQLKAIAEAQDVPKVSSSYRGNALKWNCSKEELDHYDIVLTLHILFLNIFILSCSLASSNYLYQKLYKNIEGKTNPGYSLFWAIVILSVVWNVGPSWLVLSHIGNKLYISLAIVVPLQFIVALLVSKKFNFPIPGFRTLHSAHCTDVDVHSLSKTIFLNYRCALSHIIQVLSIWSLLITFTFVMHYTTSVILSLYMDPLNSLVKLVFVKAVILSFVINIALIFAVDVISLKCSLAALKQNMGTCVSVLVIVSLLPLLSFLMFVIGGIIFNESPGSNSWKAIFTLIPSATLLYASWFSHGLLFPKGLTDPGDATKEIAHDLEGSTAKPSNNNPTHTQVTMDEATPLLPHPQDGRQSGSVRSRVTTSLESSDEKPSTEA